MQTWLQCSPGQHYYSETKYFVINIAFSFSVVEKRRKALATHCLTPALQQSSFSSLEKCKFYRVEWYGKFRKIRTC